MTYVPLTAAEEAVYLVRSLIHDLEVRAEDLRIRRMGKVADNGLAIAEVLEDMVRVYQRREREPVPGETPENPASGPSDREPVPDNA